MRKTLAGLALVALLGACSGDDGEDDTSQTTVEQGDETTSTSPDVRQAEADDEEVTRFAALESGTLQVVIAGAEDCVFPGGGDPVCLPDDFEVVDGVGRLAVEFREKIIAIDDPASDLYLGELSADAEAQRDDTVAALDQLLAAIEELRATDCDLNLPLTETTEDCSGDRFVFFQMLGFASLQISLWTGISAP